jgi:hypothetical protein
LKIPSGAQSYRRISHLFGTLTRRIADEGRRPFDARGLLSLEPFPTDHRLHFLGGVLSDGVGLMSAEEYRRKAQHFADLARLMSCPEDRAAMLGLAQFWMERAQEAEWWERKQQQKQPEKEPEGERS